MNGENIPIDEYIAKLKTSEIIPKARPTFFGSYHVEIMDELKEKYPSIMYEVRMGLIYDELERRRGKWWTHRKLKREIKRAGNLHINGLNCFSGSHQEFRKIANTITEYNWKHNITKLFKFLKRDTNMLKFMRSLYRIYPMYLIRYYIKEEQKRRFKNKEIFEYAESVLEFLTLYFELAGGVKQGSSIERMERRD